MNRIAITCGSLLTAKALSYITGYDLTISPSFPLLSFKYQLGTDIELCEWPDSYVYCLGAFTERIIVEKQYGDNFVSDGSVLKELVWLKTRYPRMELIYEQSMIHSLERILAEYTAKNYDTIFLLTGLSTIDTRVSCFIKLFDVYGIPYSLIGASNNADALQMMAEQLCGHSKLSVEHALSKAKQELDFK